MVQRTSNVIEAVLPAEDLAPLGAVPDPGYTDGWTVAVAGAVEGAPPAPVVKSNGRGAHGGHRHGPPFLLSKASS